MIVGSDVTIKAINAPGRILRARSDDRGVVIYTVKTDATPDGLYYAREFELEYRDLCTVLSREQRNEMMHSLGKSALKMGIR